MAVSTNPGATALTVMVAGLGGGVVGLSCLSGLADDRGDVDDAAPARLDHGGHDGLAHQEGPGEIGGEDVIPVLALHAHGEDIAGDTGVVDEDADGAEGGKDGPGALLNGIFAGDVEGEGLGGAPGGGDLGGDLGEFLYIAGGEGYGGA
jgi:hypothetical protein